MLLKHIAMQENEEKSGWSGNNAPDSNEFRATLHDLVFNLSGNDKDTGYKDRLALQPDAGSAIVSESSYLMVDLMVW